MPPPSGGCAHAGHAAGRHEHIARSDSHTEPQRPCPHVSSVHMSQLRSWPHATAAAATSSTDRRHGQCCSCASLTPVAHRMQQATLSRLSDLRAGEHACQMQTSTVGSHEHACTCAASVVAHCAAVPPGVHPRGTVSIPPCRSTSAAIAQQRVGLFRPDKVSSRLRDQGSMAMAVSASDASMRGREVFL